MPGITKRKNMKAIKRRLAAIAGASQLLATVFGFQHGRELEPVQRGLHQGGRLDR